MMQPRLRFENYENEWRNTFLNELLTFNNGINASKGSYGHGRKFINVLDILNNNYVLYNDIIGSVSVNAKIEETNKVEYGDIIFLRSSETRQDVGKSTVYLDKSEFSLFGGFIIRGKKIGEYNPFFLKLVLETSPVREQICSQAGGSTRYNVSQSILSSVELLIPSMSEQQKIADFFTLLDQRIEQQKEKIKAWCEYKKSMGQKLFSQEFRFKDKDGQDFPEWKKTKLRNVLKERKSYAEKTDGYSHASLSTKGISLKTERYNRDFLVTDKQKKYKITHLNDICYNPANLKFGVITRNKIGDVIFSPIYVTFTVRKGYSPIFIEYYLCRNDFIQKVRKYEEGTVFERMAVKPNDFLRYEGYLPVIDEQEKIANFLYKIEIKIEKEEEKLHFFKEQKKSLMQQMFV